MSKYNLNKILNTRLSNDDIVRVFDVVDNETQIKEFIKKGLIRESFLKKFFCTEDLDKLPTYWIDLQRYPKEKGIFVFLSILFLNAELVKKFAENYTNHHNGGNFEVNGTALCKNIRNVLIQAKVAEPYLSKADMIPYDLSIALYNISIGRLFKQLLIDRLKSAYPDVKTSDNLLFDICEENKFSDALGISHEMFCNWLNGIATNGSYIQHVEISNFCCIKDTIELDFEDSKEIYLLGKNGDGKTLLLMAIFLAFNGNHISNINDFDPDLAGGAQKMMKGNPTLKGHDETGRPYGGDYSSYLEHFFAYGTHRGRHGSTSEAEKYGFMSLFDINQTMINPLEWIKNAVFRQITQSGSTINPDVIDETNIKSTTITESTKKETFSAIQNIFDELLERKVSIELNPQTKSDFRFLENGAYLTLDQLSEGYRSVIIFICDLLCRLYGNDFSGIKSTGNLKGVVLIDEIDAHLHPSWQRQIVGKLRKLFPEIQFICTTHSPSVIQGAKSDAIIYRVYRKDGITKVSEPYYKKDLNYMMLNTLMTSSLFELEDARLDSENNEADTSDTYLSVRIENKIKELIQKENLGGFLSDEEIDQLVEAALLEDRNYD